MSNPWSVSYLGGDAIVGEPEAVAALSSRFRAIAEQVATVRQDVIARDNDVRWTGEAADSYRNTVKSLPDDLRKVHDSYAAVADALRTYEGGFRDCRDISEYAARRAEGAERRLEQVARARSSGQADANPDYWNTEEQRARDDLDLALRDARSIKGRFQRDFVEPCRWRIQQASEIGIKNDFGNTFQRWVVDDGGQIVGGVWHGFTDLIPALTDLLEHPSGDGFWRVVRDATVVLAVVVLVVPGLGIVGWVLLGLDVASTGKDVVEGKWGNVALDALGFVPGGFAARAGRRANSFGREADALAGERATLRTGLNRAERQLGHERGAARARSGASYVPNRVSPLDGTHLSRTEARRLGAQLRQEHIQNITSRIESTRASYRQRILETRRDGWRATGSQDHFHRIDLHWRRAGGGWDTLQGGHNVAENPPPADPGHR